MGLAAAKKRTKISHDPNNTSWSRSTTGYGHRIMSAQGWTPGSFLGATNAAHSSNFTAASASHIRVVLKDDTLGLGARPRNPLSEDEPTGLDAFQDLLGRLNGKSEVQIVKEQRHRQDIKLLSYVERRWKCMTFIPGGYLVKEEPIKILSKTEEKEQKDSSRRKDRSRKEKKSKKSKLKEKTVVESAASSSNSDSTSMNESLFKGRMDRSSDDNEAPAKEKKKKPKKRKRDEASEASKESPPERHSVIKVIERRPLGRHVIRSRHIQQKKKALLDSKSLNEIFMTS